MAPWRAWVVYSLVLVATVVASKFFLQASLYTRVNIAVVAGLGLRLLQCFLGPMRRCSGHWFIQYSAMAAYYLPGFIVGFIASAVWRSSDGNIYHATSCILLIINCSGVAVEMAAYARIDSPPKRWDHFKLMLSIFPLLWYFPGNYRYAVFIGLGYILYVFTIPLMKSAADRMNKDPKMIQIKEILLRRADMADYRNVCLSYSYCCRLLTKLHFRIPSTDEEDPNEEIMERLLTNYKEVFTIVDVQLAFLHDYCFTSYHSMIWSPPAMLSVGQEIWKILQDILGYMAVPFMDWLFGGWLLIGDLTFDACGLVIYAVEMFIILLVVLMQRRPLLPMYWRTILDALHCLRKYPEDTSSVYSPTVTEEFVQRFLGINKCLTPPYWQDKIGQYSLIEDYDRPNHMTACVSLFKKHMLSHTSYSFKTHHPEEEEPVSLPDNVKKIVAEELYHVINDENRLLTRGTRSLERNNVSHDFSWTMDTETDHVDTILIWHIATWYCNMYERESNNDSDQRREVEESNDSNQHRKVATALSGYCAYLVAFLPQILPGESKNTMRVLKNVLEQAQINMSEEEQEEQGMLQHVLHKAKDLLGLTRMLSKEDKKAMIEQLALALPDNNLTTYQKGVKLGKELMEDQFEAIRWKVMAEFWAETILYMAPSDSKDIVDVHVERLAQGGEFLTHLWAVLSIVGILKESRLEQGRLQRGVAGAGNV